MLRFLSLLFLCLACGCSSTPPGKPMRELAPTINETLSVGDTALVPGDVLTLKFPRQPKWNQELIVVRPDGNAAFLEVDDVQVVGMSLEALDEILTGKYAKILAEPELTIGVSALAERNVFVMGEVLQPGAFPIPAGHLSLVEAIGLAEGFIRDTALLEHTQLVRWIPEENRIRTWKIDASRAEWGSDVPILLQPHDVIYVPAKPIVHVNDWIDRYLRRMIPFPYLTFIQ